MKKSDFLEQAVYPYMDKNDKPFNRQLFNDMKYIYHRDGLLTEKQEYNWNYPKSGKYAKYFE